MEANYQDYVNEKLREGLNSNSILTYQDFVNENGGSQSQATQSIDIKRPVTPTIAAIRIQRAWRRHIDVQVYRYYRDLINFKSQGEPALLLRCINPAEASLLDAAFGAHVKFRLAGENFPPNIYYKIFIHRPIQDLCANSPKDYTHAESKLPDARTLNNKSSSKKPRQGKPKGIQHGSGWYQRIENNGWRLVSDRVIANVRMDPITWVTDKKAVPFHHNSLQRREDVKLRKKHRKIEWMRKMYEKEMMRCRLAEGLNGSYAEETNLLVDGAARGMLKTVESLGEEAVEDWEIDELLDWTTGLNYDEYYTDWKKLATSESSAQQVQIQNLLKLDKEFTKFLSSSQLSPPRPEGFIDSSHTILSHNTPVSNGAILEVDETEGTFDTIHHSMHINEDDLPREFMKVSIQRVDRPPYPSSRSGTRRVLSQKEERQARDSPFNRKSAETRVRSH